ncbi:MAG: ABC transporter ATP-binding protein [Sedimentisphaerales bacterium]
MESIAISVRNVSKKFKLFNSPKERFLEAFHPFNKKYHREFWALKDINFEIKKGTTVGIIGRNGSGKSTLLQILCSILKPTTGTVAVNGRVSALLSLGAGFNPEFTGRQNAIMNGALMGFSDKEMKKRLPEIEAFADIGEFIDQPMKIYSSGMSVRLAFAAAINVNPDILIIDEALAVGDAKFQHKCFQKFHEFQNAGITIIFVSHNTDAVIRHCDTAILLERGEIVEIGEPKVITNYYLDLLFTGKISNYQFLPVLVEEGYKGFNIVHYKTKYYAVLQSAGPIDFVHLEDDYLGSLIAENKIVVAISFEEAKQLVDQIAPQNDVSLNQSAEVVPAQPKTTELDKFFEEIPSVDNCLNRKSYNKNEYRFGDKRAEIIDYLIVYGDRYDPVAVQSGDWVDIYSKTKFYKVIESPIFSFGVRTIDGMVVYASNTWFGKVDVSPVSENEIVIFKFSVRLNLIGGDYFIGLDCSEKVDGKIVHIDRRSGISHIKIGEKNIFGGLVSLETVFQEVLRKKGTRILK